MRKFVETLRWSLSVLAVVVGLSFDRTAKAAFVISSSRYADGINDVVVFRAYNDGLGGQAGTTKLQSANVTVKSILKPLIFNFQDLDGDGINDANVTGFGFNFPTNATTMANLPTGSFIRVGTSAQFSFASATPQAFSASETDGSTPQVNYTNITQFNVQGAIPGGGVIASSASAPAPFAVALVASGTSITVTGSLAPESGGAASIFPINYTDVPEPASCGVVVAMGVFCSLGRRRHPVKCQ